MKKIDQFYKLSEEMGLTIIDLDVTEFVKSNLVLSDFDNSFDESFLIGKISNDVFELEVQLYRSGADLWLKDFTITPVNNVLNVTCNIEQVIDILKPLSI